ncbi:MAG: hypothetical protein KAW12_06340 [Candidatus Aminicenantes bacterium]|nr:hypothetical protein [Candidatus Aminicenantes bacterium]
MNKKIMILLAIIGLVLLPVQAQESVDGFGNGNGNGSGSGNGNQNQNSGENGNGNGIPGFNLFEGTPFSFEGTVISCGTGGDALVAATVDGNLTVTGLGPSSYWYSLEAQKPVVGDPVSGKGYTVDYNSLERNVLTEITVNGVKVELRGEDGRPLWRGGSNGNNENAQRGGGWGGSYNDILNGVPFTYEGEVICAYTSNFGMTGSGMQIATAAGNISVVGMGPQFYWEISEVDRPVAGDIVTAKGFAVDYNGNAVNVLMSITVNGVFVQLRDPETGAPLWRGGRNND